MGRQPRGQPLRCLKIALPQGRLGQIWVTPNDPRCNQGRSGRPLVQLLAISAVGSAAATDLAQVVGFVPPAPAEATYPMAVRISPTVEIVRGREIGLGWAIAPRSET